MPLRKEPLINDNFYHLYNRSVASIPIFKNLYEYSRFIQTFLYYQNVDPPAKLSRFLTFANSQKTKIISEFERKKNQRVEIISYCLMPNHYHFLLKQIQKDGIADFIRLLNNSYSHYFNTKYERKGPLFEGRFKTVMVETEEQLLHLSRYIHLNPFSSLVVRGIKDLERYPHSSFPEYLKQRETNYCSKEVILNQFKDINAYKKFVVDQADYQRSLQEIKHQLLEKL